MGSKIIGKTEDTRKWVMPSFIEILKFLKDFATGVVNSYSQIFFSNKIYFGIILIIVSFFEVYVGNIYPGLFGLAAVLISNLVALFVGFDVKRISQGLYGFNSLLVGIGIGLYFEPGYLSFFILALSAVFTFFFSVALEGIIGKYGLPFLSIPFLIGIWSMSLATKHFEQLEISQHGIYIQNEILDFGGQKLLNLYNWFQDFPMWFSLKAYFISLGAIFFKYNVVAGMLIAFGLLLFSRIAFTLSLIGFYSAYIFYNQMGVEITQINYTYIGFNYILTAIAIGGFFLIPSLKTYLWTIFLVPLVAMITISSAGVFAVWGLPIYSLPFNVMVLLFLYVLKLRYSKPKRLVEVPVQNYSPEKNLYFFHNNNKRFKNHKYPVKLPFNGEWTITQAHEGEHTHKNDWKHAWDFEITDKQGKTYTGSGDLREDYYCYNKPIIAPADGLIVKVVDNIPDNDIGEMDLDNNWGNTIIIKHTELLYSKICHIKPGSFKVVQGEYVKTGDMLASCGNSGRSPYPHMHFQLQATPYIGSKTLDYPISHYILNKVNTYTYKSFCTPKLNQIVSNITPNTLLKEAFNLIPGKTMRFETDKGKTIEWEVFADSLNNTYLYCKDSKSSAYLYNDKDIVFFKNFVGNKNSLLYHFYMGAFKVQKGYYKDIRINDEFPANMNSNKFLLVLQDFIAPFYIFLKGRYQLEYVDMDDENWPSKVTIRSIVTSCLFNKMLKKTEYSFDLGKKGIEKFTIDNKKRQITAKCIN
jgi:urea transporter/murein DD-endopeptidase MepM/ murein hydrolase activator NlpD